MSAPPSAEIKEILRLHAAWLRGESDGERACLQNADLRGAGLQNACLQNACLRGACLRGAYLQNADLQNADLRGAGLRGAGLRGAYLQNADLRGAGLQNAYLQNACLQNACLRGAYLQNVKIKGGTWSNGWPRLAGPRYEAEMRTPGVVRIGCTAMSLEDWLGDKGRETAVDDGAAGTIEHQTLTHWLHQLAAAGPVRLGWVADEGEVGA